MFLFTKDTIYDRYQSIIFRPTLIPKRLNQTIKTWNETILLFQKVETKMPFALISFY